MGPIKPINEFNDCNSPKPSPFLDSPTSIEISRDPEVRNIDEPKPIIRMETHIINFK